MARRDPRSRTMLSTASVIRWSGRRMWRWFFAVLFLAAVALNVATVASRSAFEGVSDLVHAIWPDAGLVRAEFAAEAVEAQEAVAAAQAGRAEAEAGVAELVQRLEAIETELADAEALAEARLARLAAASRRWIDLSRENARLQAEAESAATEDILGEETAPEL